jgi:hypothetical protein
MDFSQSELIRVKRAFHELDMYCRKRKYKGYDPYDILLSPFPFKKLGKWPPILAIQLFKRNPINLRQLFAVPKQWNPKALGLFLKSYSLMPASKENEEMCKWLFEKLLELQTPGYPGMSWGYPFPWASPEKYLPEWSPTSVVSGFIAQGLDAYYRQYGDKRALEAIEKICLFFSDALHHTVEDDFYAISYSTVKADFCYNASLLAAQTYALCYAHTKQASYADIAKQALETVISRQKSDGSWNYSENLETGKQRVQIDFHQGFVLDSILSIASSLKYFPDSVEKALQDGIEFYRDEQFSSKGRALWRLPGNYPSDIHHQAQGIITATKYYSYSGSRRAEDLAKSVLFYTLDNFRDQRGYFYYRKHKNVTDRTSYMRWGNAWMHLAMSEILNAKHIEGKPEFQQKIPIR